MIHTIDNTISITNYVKNCTAGDIIYLKKGIYYEKVEILTDGIQIIGEDKYETIITNNDYYHKILSDYNECNTFRSYTLFVGGNNISISNLTIENSSIPSKKYGQAVALHADGDNLHFEEVILSSAQDTLFTGPLPDDLIVRHQGFLKPEFLKGKSSKQIYKHCRIEGNVDFIFGGAQALFLECDIVSIKKSSPDEKYQGYIAAPSHKKEDEFGFVFYKCKLINELDASNVYLARPWRDYGTAAFIDCEMENHINPLGFNKWNDTNRDKTARFFEYSLNVDLSQREPWVKILSKNTARKYIDDFYKFISYENK